VMMTDKASKLYRLVKNEAGEIEAVPIEPETTEQAG
jgi:hypothetical protein